LISATAVIRCNALNNSAVNFNKQCMFNEAAECCTEIELHGDADNGNTTVMGRKVTVIPLSECVEFYVPLDT